MSCNEWQDTWRCLSSLPAGLVWRTQPLATGPEGKGVPGLLRMEPLASSGCPGQRGLCWCLLHRGGLALQGFPCSWTGGQCPWDWAAASHGHVPSAVLLSTNMLCKARLSCPTPCTAPHYRLCCFINPWPVAFSKKVWLELPALPPRAAVVRVCQGPAQTHGVTMWTRLGITVALKPSHSASFSGGSGNLQSLSCSQQELSLGTSTVSVLRINSSQQRHFINCLLCSEEENSSCFNKPLLRDFFPKTSFICTPRLFYQLV